MNNLFHQNNKEVLDSLKSFSEKEPFFKKLFLGQSYPLEIIQSLFKQKTGYSLDRSYLIDTSFLLNNPSISRYSNLQTLDQKINPDSNGTYYDIPRVGKFLPPEFFFVNNFGLANSRSLILMEKNETFTETAFGEVPKDIHRIKTSNEEMVIFLLTQQNFKVLKKEDVTHDINDDCGMYVESFNSEVYTLIR